MDGAPLRASRIAAHLRSRGVPLRQIAWNATPAHVLPAADVAIWVLPESGEDASGGCRDAITRMAEQRIASLIWGASTQQLGLDHPLVESVPAEASEGEVAGRLEAMAHYAPLLRRLDDEVAHLQRLGMHVTRYFSEIDQEMRLAGRLQADFLRPPPEVPGMHFATLYRPASWVSGDLYDIFRIDEEHIGVFIGDVMGHGTSAALLTMFLRQALPSKTIEDGKYRVLTPAEALDGLHAVLANQKLPNQQYITAAYCVINTRTLEATVSRGGHPYPLHMSGGSVREINPLGGLIGIGDMAPDFTNQRIQLRPGDKLMLFTDGVEEELVARRDSSAGILEFTPQFDIWRGMQAPELVQAIAAYLDHKEGSLHPADDVTIAVVQIEKDAR